MSKDPEGQFVEPKWQLNIFEVANAKVIFGS